MNDLLLGSNVNFGKNVFLVCTYINVWIYAFKEIVYIDGIELPFFTRYYTYLSLFVRNAIKENAV